MTFLHITMKHKKHPYPNDADAPYEAWGDFQVCLVHDGKEERLLEFEWNLEVFIEWYLENHEKIHTESLAGGLPGESQAQTEHRLLHTDMEDMDERDELDDNLYEFRAAHYLRMAFRGVEIPNIVIGVNHSEGEISLYPDEDSRWDKSDDFFKRGNWAFSFDMSEFQSHLKAEIIAYLEIWLEKASIPKLKEQIKNSLEQTKHL